MTRKANYLICYDIASSKRVQRIARELLQQAIRIQYSVFYVYGATQTQLFEIVDSIDAIIDHAQDDVRIYTVIDSGDALGQAVDLDNPLMFI